MEKESPLVKSKSEDNWWINKKDSGQDPVKYNLTERYATNGARRKMDPMRTENPDSDSGTNSNAASESESSGDQLMYGFGSFRPRCLQIFNTIRWYVFWTCVFSLFQGFIVNGVINVMISTLEKRFDLPSSKSGLIASSNDFLAFFLVLVISYYGGQRNKPRMIGIGVFVLGLGSFIFSIPHFASGIYNYHASDLDDFENVCRATVNETTVCSVEGTKSDIQKYLYVFMLANAFHGAGSTPMFTLGTTYLDENSKAEDTSLYLGIIYCLASLGVAAGYMGGGQFLNIYTDVDKVDASSVDITPMDPRWVGAWWIPFLISGGVMFIIALPLLAYPRQLPGSKEIQLQRKSEACKTRGDDMVQRKDFGKNWKDFPRAMWNLIRNPTFLFLSLSTCTEGIIVSGIATFGAKFLQEKFNIPAALAGFVMGIITVPGAGGGMLLGGVIVKKRKLKCKSIIRLNLLVAFLAMLMGFVFLLQCPGQKIAGVTSSYVTGSEWDAPADLSHPCNSGCGCSGVTYEPVCGMDESIYFTPCHAGCNSDFEMMMGPMGPFKMYKNCSCVAEGMVFKFPAMAPDNVTTSVPTMVTSDSNNSTDMTGPQIGAFQGICMSDCKLLYVVAPLIFVGMLLTFTTVSPLQTATLRCVPETQRSLAIGLQWLILRLLGTTPGPLMLGSIIDSACKVWQDLCGKPGSCWIYEKTDMGVKLFVWWVGVKIFTVIFNFAAQYFYNPSQDSSGGDNEEEEEEEKRPIHTVEDLEVKESVI